MTNSHHGKGGVAIRIEKIGRGIHAHLLHFPSFRLQFVTLLLSSPIRFKRAQFRCGDEYMKRIDSLMMIKMMRTL